MFFGIFFIAFVKGEKNNNIKGKKKEVIDEKK